MRIELIFTACNTIVLPLNYNPNDISYKEGFEPPVYKIHLIAQILYLKPLGHLSIMSLTGIEPIFLPYQSNILPLNYKLFIIYIYIL